MIQILLYSGILSGTFVISDPTTYLQRNDVTAGNYKAYVVDGNGCPIPFPFETTVTEPDPVTIDFETTNIDCESESTGSVRVSTISGGIGPFTYQWSTPDGMIPGSTTNDYIENVPAGTYILVVTDVQIPGKEVCSYTFSNVLIEQDGIDLLDTVYSQSPDNNYNISCYGGNDGFINLSFDDNSGSYSWSGTDYLGNIFSSTSEDISGLKAGTYNLTVTDTKGCSRTYLFSLTQPDSLSINVVKSLTIDSKYNIGCYGGTGSLDITTSGGSVGTYSYFWTDLNNPSWNSTLEDQNSLVAGSYQVVVTDANGCQNTRNLTLTQPDSLKLTATIGNISCASGTLDDGSIDLTVAGGEPIYTYAWTGPSGYTSTTEDISNLITGIYSVTVTDNYGCNNSIDVNVPLPEAITLSKHISDYNGYNIGCYGSSDGWLKVTPLTGEPSYTYSWVGPGAFSSVSDSIFGLSEGDYIVTVTDSKLCTVTDTTSLVSPGPIGMIVNISTSSDGGFNINCAGSKTGRVEITSINAAGKNHYAWSDGDTLRLRNNIGAGKYTIILTDGNGCTTSTTITLSEPGPIELTFDSISPFCHDSNDGMINVYASGGVSGYTYLWNTGADVPEITGISDGKYTVIVTDANGCPVTGSVTLDPQHDLCIVIPNAFSPNADGINDYWNLERIELYPEAEIFILNRWGELVWKSEKGYPTPWDGRSNGKELPIDSYHYTIDLHNGEKPVVGHITIVR